MTAENTTETFSGGIAEAGRDEVLVYAGPHYGARYLVVEREGRLLTVFHRASGHKMTLHLSCCEPIR